MRTLFFLFLLCLIGVGLSFLISQDPGYIVVGYNHLTIATSLWVGLVILIFFYFVLYFLMRLLTNISSIPAYFSRRRFTLNLQRYQKYMTQGIQDLSVGNYRAAEKIFLKLSRRNNEPTVYLLAAQATQAQLAYERRDHYFKLAFQASKGDTFAISLVQGLYYLQAGQEDEALVVLKQLYKTESKNVLLLNALKTIYFKHQDWQSIELILPQLKKYHLISKEELAQLKSR